MARKPIIVYIETESKRTWEEGNSDRDALEYFLREHCGCEVLLYEHRREFERDLPRLKLYNNCNLILLVMVQQEEYSDQHKKVIQCARDNFSETLPIVVFPEGWSDERFTGIPGDKSVYTLYQTDPELTILVESLMVGWKPAMQDWLGAESAEDQAILLSQLERAYHSHQSDSQDGSFGCPDHNHAIVAEALRIKLIPADCVKAEFDDTLQDVTRIFSPVTDRIYHHELAKVARMTEEENTNLSHALMRAMGHEPAGTGGGVYVVRASCGPNVAGFAIDPVTMQTFTTHTFGMHRSVGELLYHRIIKIESLFLRKDLADFTNDEEWECKRRIITGLIFSEIAGFTTPFIQLFGLDLNPADLRRILKFFKKEKKFIPVDHGGKLMKG